ncbi:MAG TPA: hypothetical protein VJP39_05490 [Gaiellaceae bacterium]|nr:hypothetical protein [Gaiellaceae bacterium]
MLALLLAGCGATKTVTRTVTVLLPPETSGVQSYYGHIVSLQRSSAGYLMRFDPALFLSGVTANAAAAADLHVACAPEKCEAVPNDNYVVDESNRSYVFRVPESVRGTVLTSGSNLNGTSILVAQLAQIVAGKGMRLFEPLESGVWIRVQIDTVQTFSQQYRP